MGKKHKKHHSEETDGEQAQDFNIVVEPNTAVPQCQI